MLNNLCFRAVCSDEFSRGPGGGGGVSGRRPHGRLMRMLFRLSATLGPEIRPTPDFVGALPMGEGRRRTQNFTPEIDTEGGPRSAARPLLLGSGAEKT